MAKFSKRHYEAIAEAFQTAFEAVRDNPAHFEGVRIARNALIETFKENGQFKEQRFMAACVPGANVKARG